MAANPTSELITPEQFLHMPENRGAELVDGRIVEKSMGSRSAWIGTNLIFFLGSFVREHSLGLVFGPENGLQLWPDRLRHVRKPDVSFFRAGRLAPGQIPDGWLATVPDLVVEVVSPNDEVEEFERKLLEYLEAGIPLIWVILPGTRSAQVITATSRGSIRFDGSLDGGDILPGFSLKLTDLFAGLEERP